METKLGFIQRITGSLIFICIGLELVLYKHSAILTNLLSLKQSEIITQIVGYAGLAFFSAILINIILKYQKNKSILPIKGWINVIVYILFIGLMIYSSLKYNIIFTVLLSVFGAIHIVVSIIINLKKQ